MTPLYLSVTRSTEGDLAIGTADANGRTELTEVVKAGPGLDRVQALCRAMKDGAQSISVFGELSEALGGLLFTGAIGQLLRESIAQTEVSGIMLTLDDQTDQWPWELSKDAETGIRPAIDAGIVRVWGREHRSSAMAKHGLLVIPKNQGAAKIKAVQAAASGVARKHDLSVYPADPATGPGLRRLLEGGAAILHLETDGDSRAHLDDGPVPLDRLGIGSDTWFTLLSGPKVSGRDARHLRNLGAPLVMGSQFDTSPHQASAVYRAIYKSLGSGESVAGAVVRARFALEKVSGSQDYSWAAPVLYASPNGLNGEPALEPFPPAFRQAPGASALVQTTDSALTMNQSAMGAAPLAAPMSAAAFVTETLRVLTLGQGSDADRAARAQTLRQLGGQRQTMPTADLAGMSPNERIRMLADTLVSDLARVDDPLGRPDDLDRRIQQISQRTAFCPLTVKQLTMTIRASRVTCLLSADMADGANLVEMVASSVYGYHARRVPFCDTSRLLATPQMGRDQQFTSGGGWLYRTIASNWRRDEIDPFQPEQADPVSRMPLVSRCPTGWRVHEGGWLVISHADKMSEAELIALQQALDAQVFEAMSNDGRICRIRIPNDFRVILIAHWRPSALPSATATVEAHEMSEVPTSVERWMDVAADRVGAPRDAAGAGGRRLAAEAIGTRANWLRLGTECSNSMAETALCHGILHGGEPAVAGLAGLRSVVGTTQNEMPAVEREYVASILDGEWPNPKQMRTRLLALIEKGQFRTGPAYVQLFGEVGGRRGDSPDAAKGVLKKATDASLSLSLPTNI